MRLIRSKRAVSNVIATIILINIAVASGILLYAWANGLFSAWIEGSKLGFQSRGERMDENISLENIRYMNATDSTYIFNITVRNVGSRDVWVAALFLNATDVFDQVDWVWNSDGDTVTQVVSGLHAGTYHLVIGESLTFAFDDVTPSFQEGDVLVVVVVTERGSRVVQDWEVSA